MNTKNKEISSPFKIESNVPMPITGKNFRSSKYPFRDMKVGDSFYVPSVNRLKVAPAASYFAIRNKGYKFSVRKEGDGFRVWRIKAAA